MIDLDHNHPVRRQAQVLDISRGSACYRPRPVSQGDLVLMRRIDELHLEHPARRPTAVRPAAAEGHLVGRLHGGTLMASMGIEALYKKPNTSRKHPLHPIYPHLLRGFKIERGNQV